jgi:hypothetical protein
VKPDKHVQFAWVDGAGADHGGLSGLGDDDHSQYLLANGVRSGSFAVVGSGAIPTEADGSRMMWYGNKSAFRAGFLQPHEAGRWEDANIGQYSVALGYNPQAKGRSSFATGDHSRADGETSTAIGWGASAAGRQSVAIGRNSIATGFVSVALGDGAVARHDHTFVYHDNSNGGFFQSTAAEQFLVSAAGGLGVNLNDPTPGGLSVNGVIESRSGGIKFPDGTTQTSAAGAGAFIPVNGTAAATDGFAVTGTSGAGTIPARGRGTRLMWYPGKAAFRAGEVYGSEWDDANVGRGSVAAGQGTEASGNYAVALGDRSVASGTQSVAIGNNNVASGAFNALAMGVNSTASGSNGAVAIGFGVTASGIQSTAIGNGTLASGQNAMAMGVNTVASGFAGTAMGQSTNATGRNSTAMGYFVTASRTGAFVYGDQSTSAGLDAPADNSFTVRASGGVNFYSNSSRSAGVSLATGAGAWATVSDRNRKQDFREESGERALARIADMPIQSWSYLSQDPSIRHLGPVAQDFYEAFALGDDDKTITTSDISGVNMLAVQALEKRTRDLATENEVLRERLIELEAMLLELMEQRR